MRWENGVSHSRRSLRCRLRHARVFTNGFIRFTVPGKLEFRGGLQSAMRDENAVTFRRGQARGFNMIRAAVEHYITAHHAAARSGRRPRHPRADQEARRAARPEADHRRGVRSQEGSAARSVVVAASGAATGARAAHARYLISVSSLNIGRYMEMITMPTMTPTPSIMIGSTIEVSAWTEASTSSS